VDSAGVSNSEKFYVRYYTYRNDRFSRKSNGEQNVIREQTGSRTGRGKNWERILYEAKNNGTIDTYEQMVTVDMIIVNQINIF
jgi:hypothetical protein